MTSILCAGLSAITFTTELAYSAPSTILGRVREGYFLIAGYPSTIVSNGPPQEGLISLIQFFSSSAQTIASANGVSSCLVVPASGTASGTMTVPSALTPFVGATGTATIMYETPLVTAPTGWNGAGAKFAKRVKVTKTGGFAFVMEFNCGTNEMFTSLSIPGDNVTSSNRDLNMYVKKSGVALSVDFYMTVQLSNRTSLVDSQFVRLETTDGIAYKVWNVGVTMRDTSYLCGGSSCGDQFGYERSVIVGDSNTKMASVYAKVHKPAVSGSIANKQLQLADANTASVAVGAKDFSVSEPNQGDAFLEKSGCVNFATPSVDPATSSYCPGVGSSLPVPAAPLVDSLGAVSVNWVKNTLATKMYFAN